MKNISLFFLLSLLLPVLLCIPLSQSSNDSPLNIYALLVAGSNGIENYRHQADVAHSYHVLREKGIPAKNIVVMMYDDVANNPHNPTPGQLRNSPGGPDYYKGLAIDYRGADVTVDNFRAVLRGRKDMVTIKDKSTGRVLESTATDNIFLFYADHGATGFVGMPNNEYLTKSTLQAAIRKANFSRMAVYIEACESGSMLDGMQNDPRVFGMTASTATQPSYACNCDSRGFCYGDLFSVKWMEDSEKYDLNKHDLLEQFNDVKAAVSRSTVVRFGTTSLNPQPVSHFQGQTGGIKVSLPEETNSNLEMVPALDVPLFYYSRQAKVAATEKERQEAGSKFMEIMGKRKLVDVLMKELVHNLEKKVLPVGEEEKDEECMEKIVNTFNNKCHSLGKSPYLASKMRSFTSLLNHRLCNDLVEELDRSCSSVAFATSPSDVFV